MDNKRRRYFILLDKEGLCMGRGTYYSEGNIQLYLEPDKTALQMQLADALMLEGVGGFYWDDEENL